jgi:beta-glucosidase
MHWRSTLAAVLGLTLAASATAAAAPDAQHGPKQPVIGQPRTEHGCARIEKSLPTLKDWPRVESQFKGDRRDEARIKAILKDMTLACDHGDRQRLAQGGALRRGSRDR